MQTAQPIKTWLGGWLVNTFVDLGAIDMGKCALNDSLSFRGIKCVLSCVHLH